MRRIQQRAEYGVVTRKRHAVATKSYYASREHGLDMWASTTRIAEAKK